MNISMGCFVTQRVKLSDGGAIPSEEEPSNHQCIEMMIALLRPVSSGELRLASPDPKIQPLLDYNYLTDPFDRERLREGVRLALRLAEHEGLKAIIGPRIEPADANLVSDEAVDEWLLREVTTYSHISGTCKMGSAADPMAVVDQYGKVRGLEGLRVVDASIMPDLVRAPINPTVLMLGERMADFIKQGK